MIKARKRGIERDKKKEAREAAGVRNGPTSAAVLCDLEYAAGVPLCRRAKCRQLCDVVVLADCLVCLVWCLWVGWVLVVWLGACGGACGMVGCLWWCFEGSLLLMTSRCLMVVIMACLVLCYGACR